MGSLKHQLPNLTEINLRSPSRPHKVPEEHATRQHDRLIKLAMTNINTTQEHPPMMVVRLKQRTRMVDYAERRMNAARAIDNAFDFGNGLTASQIKDLIETYDEQCIAHNNAAEILEEMTTKLKGTEEAIESLADRLLDAVAAKYGRSSSEYKLVGSIRKNPTKAAKAKAKDPTKPESAKLDSTEPTPSSRNPQGVAA
jgi:hypothetical protein